MWCDSSELVWFKSLAMLSLTKKTDYALIALVHLAKVKDPDGLVSAREIADSYQLSHQLLMNILKVLSNAGILSSVRGPKGGYRLDVSPAEITVDTLIEAIEGRVRFVQCAELDADDGHACGLLETCPIRWPAVRIHERLRSFLQGITVADLMSDMEHDAGPVTPLTVSATGMTPAAVGSAGDVSDKILHEGAATAS